MSEKEILTVNANVDITAASLQAVVENVKKIASSGEEGGYPLDPADVVSEMISRFLLEKDFETFVKNTGNYQHYSA
jgi:hypothetical protein